MNTINQINWLYEEALKKAIWAHANDRTENMWVDYQDLNAAEQDYLLHIYIQKEFACGEMIEHFDLFSEYFEQLFICNPNKFKTMQPAMIAQAEKAFEENINADLEAMFDHLQNDLLEHQRYAHTVQPQRQITQLH